MRDSSNLISVFTDSINDIADILGLEGIEIEDKKRIKLNIKGSKKKLDYKYEKEYNSVEEFNNRNKELEDYRYYIAYGSNMSLAQMGLRCKDSRYYGLGYLENYRLEFRDKYSNVKINESTRVPVVVYKISKEDK